jgi:hypothetical protein
VKLSNEKRTCSLLKQCTGPNRKSPELVLKTETYSECRRPPITSRRQCGGRWPPQQGGQRVRRLTANNPEAQLKRANRANTQRQNALAQHAWKNPSDQSEPAKRAQVFMPRALADGLGWSAIFFAHVQMVCDLCVPSISRPMDNFFDAPDLWFNSGVEIQFNQDAIHETVVRCLS